MPPEKAIDTSGASTTGTISTKMGLKPRNTSYPEMKLRVKRRCIFLPCVRAPPRAALAARLTRKMPENCRQPNGEHVGNRKNNSWHTEALWIMRLEGDLEQR